MRRAAALLVVTALALSPATACDGCAGRPVPGDDEDAGPGGGGEGEGETDSGPSEGEGEGEGEPRDAGPFDGGNGFDLGSLLDGGIPDELSCLPTELPELSVTGALDALGLTTYSGTSERGVKCDEVVCGDRTPCCALCGFGACAAVTDAGVAECPLFTTAYACDGEEECSGNDVCCFTLGGTECRTAADCDFDVGGALSDFLGDGGIRLPDAGPPVDGGFIDGGSIDVFIDGGIGPDGGFVDGGSIDVFIDGGPGPQYDAGSFVDSLQETLDQGVPVCRSTLFDCDLFRGELCCTSERLTAVDVGFCLPGVLCLGDFLP